MELTQLTYFLTVAQMQHMTRAAEALHIAQPALTKSVQRLESELRVPLIARGAALRSRPTVNGWRTNCSSR